MKLIKQVENHEERVFGNYCI